MEFQPFTTRLRIRGVVVEGPEKFGVKGKYHTLSVGIGSELEIIKEEPWPRILVERLKRQPFSIKLLLVAIDYDEYAIALLEQQGVKLLAGEDIKLPGKDDPHREDRLREVITVVAKMVVKAYREYQPFAIIVGGPGFLKNDLVSKLRTMLPSVSILVDTVSMGGEKGISELIRRDTVRKMASEVAVIEAEKFFDEFDKNLAKNPELVSYGIEEVEYAVENGAADTILVLDELLHSINEETRKRVESILRKAEETRAKIVFINTHSEPGIRLKMLGGIAALHRYPLPKLARKNTAE